MSETVIPPTGEERRLAEQRAARQAQRQAEQDDQRAQQDQPRQLDALHTEHGDTSIADTVVAKIAAIAAREVPGVFAMGNAARRAIGNLTQRVTGATGQANVSSGVSVEKGERETAISVSVVVEYGASIVAVADGIRENIIRAVEFGTGLEVISVDISVTDVHLPDDDDTAGTAEATSADLR